MALLRALLLVLSSVAMLTTAREVTAHETSPAVADFSVIKGELRMAISLNGEALAAGIDLEGVENTDDTEQSANYDALRNKSPDLLEKQLEALWPDLKKNLRGIVDGRALDWELRTVEVDEIGNPDLPRQTLLAFAAKLPTGAASFRFGWDASYGALVLRQISEEQGDEALFTGLLRSGALSDKIALNGATPLTGWGIFTDFIPVGFDHILPQGLDHILFVLALFFLSTQLRPLIWQISMFTLAHTITLALGAAGWIGAPGSIVEPLIAASICFVAIENIYTNALSRWRPYVVFAFGLLHGLGFASVLGEYGLPEGQFLAALIGFNIGVEVGQLTVVALAFLAVGAWFRHKNWYRARISIPASCLIAAVGAFWVVERTLL